MSIAFSHPIQQLVDDAVALAHPDDTMHGGRLWRSVGGRPCPVGWDHCSQPVFTDLRTGETDYGEPGGPGHADCKKNCRERMLPPEPEPDGPPVPDLVLANFSAAAAAAKRFTRGGAA